jgi:hypothetical protein
VLVLTRLSGSGVSTLVAIETATNNSAISAAAAVPSSA